MKIYGPYLRKDGRKHIVIVHDDGKKQTKSWPRYLMEQHLGRELLTSETVDHIDGDFTNDKIENLQLLTLTKNIQKSIKYAEKIMLICKTCGKEFERRKAIEYHNRNIRKQDGPFCSHSCVGKIHH